MIPGINYIVSKYLGVPYKYLGDTLDGLDCINLCTMIGRDRGINIPNINHQGTTIDDYQSIFNVRNDVSLWKKVEPKEDCLVVFKINGVVRHVGYMIDDEYFIHIMQNSNVTVDRITNPQWERRVVGFYEYIGNKEII